MVLNLHLFMNQPFGLKHVCSLRFGLRLSTLVLLISGFYNAQAQSPTGGTVVNGTANIVQNSGLLTTIQQNTPKAIIDWQSFSIGTGNTVKFMQPNSSAIVLNRVTGNQVSQINGTLQANGQVWLLNPNGMLIGAGGQINIGAFLGSTHTITNQQFMSGDYHFSGAGIRSMVVNQGKILATNGGYAVLAGKAVRNEGTVQANLGQVVLGGAKQFSLDVVGDQLLSFAITGDVDVLPQDGKALVDNAGTLQANGGRVTMTARAVRDVIDMVVNTSGLLQATKAGLVNGEIVLSAGDFGQNITGGRLNVSGIGSGETGGVIKVLGNKVTIAPNAQLDATGDSGGGKIYVGGGWQGALLDGQNNALKTKVESGAVLNASALNTGNGGDVVVWVDTTNPLSARTVAGNLLAKGGALSGVDGRVEPLNTSNTTTPTSPPVDSSTNPPASTTPATSTNPPSGTFSNPPNNAPANNGSAVAINSYIQAQLLPPQQQIIGNRPFNPVVSPPVSSVQRPINPQGNSSLPAPIIGNDRPPRQEVMADIQGSEGMPRPDNRLGNEPPPPSAGTDKAPRKDMRSDTPPPPTIAEELQRQDGKLELPPHDMRARPAIGKAPLDVKSSNNLLAAPLPAVMVNAPSPLPLTKPPTPKDTADTGDKTLSSVTPYTQPKPPANPKRAVMAVISVTGSTLMLQQVLPPKSQLTPGIETRFSGTANSVYW